MTSPYVDLLYHFVPLLAISLAVLINLTVTHWRTEARAATDASRLRAALRAELTILQDVYDENLRTLNSGREFLLSSRQLISLYRGNLGRIQLLTPHEVPMLVAAYGFVEVIESFLAATCKPHGHAYRTVPGETPVGEIRQKFATGIERIITVLQAMEHLRPEPDPVELPGPFLEPQGVAA